MVQPAEVGNGDEPPSLGALLVVRDRRLGPKRLVRPILVVVAHELLQDPPGVVLPHHDQVIEALAAAPPPKAKTKNAPPAMLGFFVTEKDRIQLIYSSTFSRLAYLLAVRLFIRSRVGLAPTPLP